MISSESFFTFFLSFFFFKVLVWMRQKMKCTATSPVHRVGNHDLHYLAAIMFAVQEGPLGLAEHDDAFPLLIISQTIQIDPGIFCKAVLATFAK